jgi:hypothetical protein
VAEQWDEVYQREQSACEGYGGTWEKRPCSECGHVRRVKVTRWKDCLITFGRKGSLDGVELERELLGVTEVFSKLCSACQHMEDGRMMQQRANAHFRKAQEIRNRRSK